MTKQLRVSDWKVPTGLGLIVIVIWIGFGYFSSTKNNPGIFGDMFGSVNALFSGLAFAGIIYAILLQRRELQLQREDNELTRNQMKNQEVQLAAQNETFKLQQFENSLFQLINYLSTVVSTMIIGADKTDTKVGRACFRVMYNVLRGPYAKIRLKCRIIDNEEEALISEVQQSYDHVNGSFSQLVTPYFNTLFEILNFIDVSEVSNKQFYSDILRAQLSPDELTLIFYYGCSKISPVELKTLIERYAVLKYVPKHELLDESHLGLYKDEAFG